jgi:hypothetical protein
VWFARIRAELAECCGGVGKIGSCGNLSIHGRPKNLAIWFVFHVMALSLSSGSLFLGQFNAKREWGWSWVAIRHAIACEDMFEVCPLRDGYGPGIPITVNANTKN